MVMNIKYTTLAIISMVCFGCHSKHTLYEGADKALWDAYQQRPVMKHEIHHATVKVLLGDSTSSAYETADGYYYAEYANTTNDTVFILTSYLHDLEIQADVLYQQDDSATVVLRALPFVKYLVFDSTSDYIILNKDRILRAGQVRYEFLKLEPRQTMRILLSKKLFDRRLFYETVDYEKAAESGVSSFSRDTIGNSLALSSGDKYIELAAYDDVVWCNRFFDALYHKYFIEKSLSFKRIRIPLTQL